MKKVKVYDGFEQRKLSNLWRRTRFEEGSIKMQSKIVRKGKRAAKITVRKGDKFEAGGKNSDTERDELLEQKEFWSQEGEIATYSFSIYLPKSFLIVPTRLVLAQWKQHEGEDKVKVDNPLIALRYQNGKFRITLQTTKEKETLFQTKKEIRGKWLDFRFKIKFTRTKGGFVKVWMNKKKIINYEGRTAYSEKYNYSKPGKFLFKMGLYRDKMCEPMTAYFDEYKKELIKI
jgi:hypothetical protein